MTSLQTQSRAWPHRSEHVQARKVGRDTLIVHLLLKQYHVLNHVAGRIWDLADGERSADDIAEEIAAEFKIDRATVGEDVTSTLRTLSELRLIEIRQAP
jgi:pyrroloquinoline quinone biosynthesis protein D